MRICTVIVQAEGTVDEYVSLLKKYYPKVVRPGTEVHKNRQVTKQDKR